MASFEHLNLIEYNFTHFPFAEKFHTLALEGVPILGLHNRTAAYRFVTLVDVCPSSS
jgi:predicted ATPase